MEKSTDPLVKIFKAPLKKVQEKNRQHYYGFPSIVPDMTPEMEHACLAEIRLMKPNVISWKKLPNGMTAGQFAFLYVYHFKQKRGPYTL
jgi:hypothetical protein